MHQPPVRFTYRLLSYLISTIIAGQPLLPAVGAVITPQNGAGMDKAANGVPVVNIATPDGAGISHNRFTDYNVGKEGLILNNATGKLNPTQLGGLIQNNPNLKAGGEAKGIINEVTGGNRSLLQGYTEVAGKAANVMVANPYGITCDGCGFINTPHATLTTGRPVMNADGSLQALEVTEGSITINGAGLDGTRSDAVSIIARATEVNAALHAKDLTVTAGANRVTADGRVSALKGEGDVPKVAVDTGALGGMYARRIHLTSTERGVGVNLGNLYARDGDITLDASGRLTVNNSLATGAVTAKGQGVTLTGDHKAGGNLSVSSRSDIVLSNGTLNSDKDLSLTAGGRITQQNEKLTAGRDVTLAAKNITQDTASQINAARDIVTVASDTLTTQGQITAGRNLTASATTLTQDGILLAKGHAGLDAGTLNNSGAVQGASLTLGSTTLSNSGSLLSGGPLTVNTRDFTQSGRTGAKGKVDITASGKLTSTGSLVSDDVLVLKAQDVTQNGVLSGGKGLTVSAQALSSGKKSVTHSDAAMTLNVTTVALDGETSAGDTLRVQADKLSTAAGAQLQSGKNLSINARDARLAGTQAAQQTMVVNASEKLTHSGKSSAPSLSLIAPELTSSGVLVASALNTQSQTLTNSGLLQGEASLTVNTQRLDNQQNGTLYSAADLTLDIPDIRNSGLITGDNGLTLNTASLSNPGKITADTLNVRATTLDGDGLLQGAGALALAGDTLSQGRNGRWLTAGDLSLRGKTLNTAGTTQGQNLTVQADRWANSGSVLATGNLTASATGQLTSTGDIMSQGDTTLKAATTDNRGSLLSAGTLSLDGNSLDNSGTVQGDHVTIRQNSVTNSGTLTGIAALTLAARMVSPQPALMNNGGSLLTSGDLTITAGSITSSGHWQGKRVLITADSLANSGAIQAADSLTARLTGELVSTAGSKVTSNGEMALSALNLSNSGQWIAKNLTLKANSLTSAGDITGVDALTLTVNQTLNNHASGKLLSAGVLTLKADSVTNDGQLQGNATTITAGQLTNGGHLQGETLTLAASGGVNNRSGGVLMSRNALNVSTLLNSALIYAGNNLKLFTDRLHNQHGDILAGNSLWVQKDSSGTANSEIINRSGNIETTRGDITMNTAHLLNSWDAISASHEVIPGSSRGVISPVPENNRWWGVVRHDGVEYLAVYWGEGATVPDEYRIRTGDTETVTVSASGHAARISGGADMHIRAGRLDNEASFILAGGSMTLSGDTLNNQGWQEGTTGKETVWRLASGSLPKAWFTEPWYKVYRQVSPDATEASGTSPAGQYRAVISAAGDVSASFATDTGNTTVMLRAGGAGNTITVPSLNSLTPPTVSQGVSGEALLNESGTGITGPVWNDALPDTLKDIPGALSLSGASVSSYPLPSGNNGYFVPSTDPDSPYLITVNPKLDGLGKVDSSLFAGLYDLLRMQPGEAPRETDPAYTDEKQFLGSSYILDRLGLKPEKDYRFLGDAAFDTRYVSNVILNQTGSRYINGTGSDLAQMKYLMDSAAAQQKALGLTFGVSLTAGQVAQLTRSILWWESVTINGQTVMVPKLYLSPEDITLHNGSVISGNNVQLAGGNITNSGGSINAQNDLLLDSTGSIDNLNAGLINAGGALNLKAIGDIGNISSVISGKTVSLESATGNISNLTRTEQWAMNNGYNHFSGTDTGPLAAVRATDSLFMGAAGDISITGAAVSAGDSVLLSAGNDLNMNAIQAGERRRYGGSGWYETHAVAPTVTAGNSLMLSAGRDVNSQAAGITAENSMAIRAGRDVNMAAESTGAGDHDSTFSMKTVHDSVRQQGTDMTSGGDITVTAGRDITSVATAVTAKGDIRVNAGHDIVLGTATESDYHYSESGETRNRLLSHQTTRTITEDSVTREKGSLLSGNRVTVNAGNNLTVQGSDVVADWDVSLAADNHVDVLAATSTDTSWRFKETKKSGLTGTGGIGFTTGSSKTTHDRREAGTTQSQSASTIGSTAGNVSITAGKQAHISGSDVIANRDISITGDSVVVDPGHDRRTVDEKFEQKKSGLTVALSGTVGSAINNAATMAREAKETSDSRLAALKGTQAVLSGVQAGVNHGLQQQSADPNNGIGVSISLNHQQSKSETKYQHDIVSGSTLSAGNNVSVTATGKNKDHNNSGDILITGSQIKSGNDTSLNAQNDILLAAAADTRQTTGKNSSKGGGVGVSFGGGTNGGGLSIFAGINGSEGREKGNGTTWTETTLDAGKNVSLTSGRDTTLSGAQVSGEKVTADVGNNLTISSLQDSDRYDSRQNSVAAGGSFTFGSMSGSGYASISQDKIKSNYDSVREQSGIYAGKDGFDVTVGNHTQLNGAVIASTATDDKNSLNTNTLGWSDIHNQADYKASHTGISLSGGSGMSASKMVASNAIAGAANALTGMSGSSGHAEGTTSSAISGGNLIIRDNESQKQDIAGLSRDPENANGSIAPIFDREKEQKRLQEAQVISQVSGQMSNIVMTYGETEAMKAARKEHPGMSDAQLRETPEYREVMKGYGTGSTPQMVVQAITGVLGGLNAGNPGQVLAGGLNPAVAQLIKQATGDNREANLMAHAVWGALAAQLGGNNAASGAAGAFSGELAARYIIDNYYGGRTDNLSEQERQQISMLATIASGIAGGLAGNSTASAGTGAQAGRNAVENNYLSYDEAHAFDREMTACRKAGGDCGDIQNKYAVISAEHRQKLHIDVATDPLTALSGEDKWNIEGGLSAAGRPGWLYGSLENQDVKNYVTESNSYDLNYLNNNTSKGDKALAFFGEPENYWGTVAGAGSLLTSSATLTEKFVSAGLSYGANGAVQIGTGNIGDKFDYLSFMMSGLTGVGTAGKGYYANQLLGAGSAYMSSQIEGQDSTASVVGSMAGTGLGYNIGASITNKLEAQYIKNQLGMDASKYSLQYSEKSIGYGMYQGGQMSSIPGTFGGFVGSFVSEGASSATQKEVDGDKK
ncbi:hemagglutinin repeat-containing protein [Escherichia coli]